MFKNPKEHPSKNQVTGIVYKVEYRSCPFVSKDLGIPGGGGGERPKLGQGEKKKRELKNYWAP